MAVIACPGCGEPVNEQATACPACGVSLRLSSDEAHAWLAEQEAHELALDHRRAVMADPVGAAKRAAEAGMGHFQVELDYDALEATLWRALGFDGEQQPGDPAVIEAIEAEGWHLEQVSHAFRPIAVVFKGPTPLWGPTPVEGRWRHFYRFRRTNQP